MVSPANAQNAVLAGKYLNDTVVEAGEIFSYNQTVGQRTEQRGFIAGLISSRSKQAVYSIGGGVCTTASILHQAVKAAGLEVIERHNHVSPTSYLPQGEDAAIWYGVEDYRFRNNLENPIRINAEVIDDVLTISIAELKPDYREKPEAVVTINGQTLNNCPAILVGNTLMIPVREIVQVLGGEIYWDQETRQVFIKHQLSFIKLEISEDTAIINEEPVMLESKVWLWKGRTIIPVSFLARAFDAAVEIESSSQLSIIINSNNSETESQTVDSAALPFYQRSVLEKAKALEPISTAVKYMEPFFGGGTSW